MDSKQITLGLAAILGIGVLVAAGFYVYTPTPEETETPDPAEEMAPTTFNSTELGLMFEYPNNYTLQTHEQGTGERMWTVLTLIDSEILRSAIENGASEGPPAIAIQIFDNQEGYTAEEWIKGSSYSNYKLSFDETLTPTLIDTEGGLAYRYSGLFETDAVVVVHGDRVYMFSVDWLTAEDENIDDFMKLLKTVSFY